MCADVPHCKTSRRHNTSLGLHMSAPLCRSVDLFLFSRLLLCVSVCCAWKMRFSEVSQHVAEKKIRERWSITSSNQCYFGRSAENSNKVKALLTCNWFGNSHNVDEDGVQINVLIRACLFVSSGMQNTSKVFFKYVVCSLLEPCLALTQRCDTENMCCMCCSNVPQIWSECSK